MDTYTTRQIAAFFGVSTQTIRLWSEEFSEYLSELANPGTGKSRRFTREDTSVFSLISELRNLGHDMGRIHADLDSGERGEVILPSDEVRAIVSSDTEVRLAVQIDHLERQLQSVKSERDQLREEVKKLDEYREETIKLRTQNEGLQKRLDDLTSEVENYHKQIRDLAIELGIERGKQMKDDS